MPDVDIPNEVVSRSFLVQSGNLASTSLYTPTVAGLVRVSMYISLSPANSTGSVSANISYTDENGSSNRAFVVSNLNGGPVGTGTMTVNLTANVALLLSTNVSLGTGVTYDLYVTVEQL